MTPLREAVQLDCDLSRLAIEKTTLLENLQPGIHALNLRHKETNEN